MTETTRKPGTRPAGTQLLPAAGRAALSILRRLGSWYDRWLQRQNLAELDDHILRDIGISPARSNANAPSRSGGAERACHEITGRRFDPHRSIVGR